VGIQVRALQRLGAEHALVVYGRDGMDEVSLGAATLVGEFKHGHVSEYEIHPEDFGSDHGEQPCLARGDP
jgi:anthranilate phosphoribosyltransferase